MDTVQLPSEEDKYHDVYDRTANILAEAAHRCAKEQFQRLFLLSTEDPLSPEEKLLFAEAFQDVVLTAQEMRQKFAESVAHIVREDTPDGANQASNAQDGDGTLLVHSDFSAQEQEE